MATRVTLLDTDQGARVLGERLMQIGHGMFAWRNDGQPVRDPLSTKIRVALSGLSPIANLSDMTD